MCLFYSIISKLLSFFVWCTVLLYSKRETAAVNHKYNLQKFDLNYAIFIVAPARFVGSFNPFGAGINFFLILAHPVYKIE